MKHDLEMIKDGLLLAIKHGLLLVTGPMRTCCMELSSTPLYTVFATIIYSGAISHHWHLVRYSMHPVGYTIALIYALPIVLYLVRLVLEFAITKLLIPRLPIQYIERFNRRSYLRGNKARDVVKATH